MVYLTRELTWARGNLDAHECLYQSCHCTASQTWVGASHPCCGYKTSEQHFLPPNLQPANDWAGLEVGKWHWRATSHWCKFFTQPSSCFTIQQEHRPARWAWDSWMILLQKHWTAEGQGLIAVESCFVTERASCSNATPGIEEPISNSEPSKVDSWDIHTFGWMGKFQKFSYHTFWEVH